MYEELKKYSEKMDKSVKGLGEELGTIRVGRANPHVLDKIRVDYYGTASTLQSVGNVTVPEPKVLMIQPWDKSLLKEIEKAIQQSDIGLNPNNDGVAIRLVFPDLTEDRRRDLVKDAKRRGEDSKVAIRNIRRDALEHFKKDQKAGLITEDDLKDYEKKMQDVTDKSIKAIDDLTKAKSDDIMSI